MNMKFDMYTHMSLLYYKYHEVHIGLYEFVKYIILTYLVGLLKIQG